MSKIETIVVNLFGKPSVGKSTSAAYIYSKLKTMGVSAELVTEFAKDVVWEETEVPFYFQEYIFGQQSYRIGRCAGKVDVIVTDSPLLLSVVYNKNPNLGDSFNKTVLSVFNSYCNKNYLLCANRPYMSEGRIHTKKEADKIHSDIVQVLVEYQIPFQIVESNMKTCDRICDDITITLLKKKYDEFK